MAHMRQEASEPRMTAEEYKARERNFTEEGFPVRTVYVSNLPSEATVLQLTRTFREFGAVLNVIMKVEQTNWMTMESALEPSDDDDIPEMKSYAYVTFLHAEGAAEAMKKEKIQIFSSTCEIHKAFTWHQPEPELDAYKATHQSLSPRLETFYNQILNALNDDCILHIMNSTSLNILDVSQMMEFHPRFNAIAENIRTVNFNPPLLQGITLWEFYKILRLQGFGHRVANLTISAKIFNSAVTDDVFLLLNQYLGPQVLKLTLNSFGLTNKQFDQLKPIFRRLNYFDIDLRYSFDFKSFHFTWNNLRTLRIRTSGFMEDFPDQANTFPVLKELMIVCGYRLHERLFERLHRSCGQITELAIITPDEYVSELSPRRIDLENLEKFKGLTKLHLSFSRTYFRTNILDVITKLKTLKYLTLEISTPLERQPEDTLFNEFNKKLRTIGVMMPELKELRLASIRLEEFRIIEMIKCAPQLESLWIVDIGIEMERFMLLIMKIVEARKFIFEDKPIVPLKLTVINFTDEVLESVIHGVELMKYLRVNRIDWKSKINKSYIQHNDPPRVLMRHPLMRRRIGYLPDQGRPERRGVRGIYVFRN